MNGSDVTENGEKGDWEMGEKDSSKEEVTWEDLRAQVKRLSLMSRNFSSREESTKTIHCKKCNDSTFRNIEENGRLFSIHCECKETYEIRRRWERSGYSEVLKEKTLANYLVEGKAKPIHRAKRMAMHYIENYSKTGPERGRSIVFVGTVGAGKTHLCMAIAGELMNRNVGVEYLSYREAITDLKQNVTSSVNYKKAINKFMMAPVLLIDDLFKGKITTSDINIFFEIINHRYLHKKPIIVSSEHSMNRLVELDGSIGSRIVEMCRGYIIHFDDDTLNHRLNS